MSASRSEGRAVRSWRVLLAFVGALAVLAPTGASMAQTVPSLDAKAWVQQHDRNGDGKLDRGEFQSAVIEGFYFRDKNKNGYLTIEELKEASPEALKTVRRKASGQITLQEYVNALFRDFEAADTDQDGLLAVVEIEIYIRTVK
jgi:Ca2+-binding EF-hand superfamily protein